MVVNPVAEFRSAVEIITNRTSKMPEESNLKLQDPTWMVAPTTGHRWTTVKSSTIAVNYPFEGKMKAEESVKKTRKFFLGRCWLTEWMLEWAKKRNAEIRPEDLLRAANEKGETEDVQRILQDIWSFLNGCLSGEGQVTFGLEAWRCLTRPVTSQSASK